MTIFKSVSVVTAAILIVLFNLGKEKLLTEYVSHFCRVFPVGLSEKSSHLMSGIVYIII